jgi:hypothetical protein
MTYDTQSPPGSWRQELLKTATSTTQLREIIADLEHCLKVARDERDALQEQRDVLVQDLARAVEAEVKAVGRANELKRQINYIWDTLRGVSHPIVMEETPRDN